MKLELIKRFSLVQANFVVCLSLVTVAVLLAACGGNRSLPLNKAKSDAKTVAAEKSRQCERNALLESRFGNKKNPKVSVVKMCVADANKESVPASRFAWGPGYKVKEIETFALLQAVRTQSLVRDQQQESRSNNSSKSVLSKSRETQSKLAVQQVLVLRFDPSIDEAAAARTIREIQTTCVETLIEKKLMSRVLKDVDYQLTLVDARSLDKVPSLEQFPVEPLGLKLMTKCETHPCQAQAPIKGFALEIWPDHSFFPSSQACQASCQSNSDRRVCLDECFRRRGENLCVSLAKLSVHLLGEDDPLAQNSCQVAAEGTHPAQAENSVMVGVDLGRAGDSPAESAGAEKNPKKSFWDTAQFQIKAKAHEKIGRNCDIKPSENQNRLDGSLVDGDVD